MTFRGLKDYHTDSPAVLRVDLQRQNLLLEKELASVRVEFQLAPTLVVTAASRQAQDGQLVVADATGGALTVTLPRIGTHVLVVKKDTTGNAVNVVPANEQQTINSATGADSSTTPGLREYFGDGAGNWWRR